MTEPHSNNPEFCQFAFSDNRQCRMLRHRNHPTLCLFHAHAEHQLLESHRLGAEMAATFTGDFLTAADINHVMGKVFTALAQNRIPQRTAATLAYLGQVMLLPAHGQERNQIRLFLRNLKRPDRQRRPPHQLPPTHTRRHDYRVTQDNPEMTRSWLPLSESQASQRLSVICSRAFSAQGPLTPLQSALPQNAPITRSESALPNSRRLKSFRIRT
jgi:hypothetical protein